MVEATRAPCESASRERSDPRTLTLGTLDDTAIGDGEIRVLKAIDGEHTVREIIAESELASFDVIQILYRFIQSRIVRTRKAEAPKA